MTRYGVNPSEGIITLQNLNCDVDMPNLHSVLVPHGGIICVAGRKYMVEGPGLSLMVGVAPVEQPPTSSAYCFPASQVQPIYRDLQPLLVESRGQERVANVPYSVPLSKPMLDAITQLAAIDSGAMLRFALAYSLTVNGRQYSAMLRHLIADDFEMFEFIDQNRLAPWPVLRYAEALGLPLAQFNRLFRQKYGVSPKQWLLTQRLEYARLQLETTSKKVIDVAMEAGFSSHPHFSDSFRRYFSVSPREVRSQPTAPSPVPTFEE